MRVMINHHEYSKNVEDTWSIRRQDTHEYMMYNKQKKFMRVSASTTIPETEVRPQANGGDIMS